MANYALLIGNSKYEHYQPLKAPGFDVDELKKVLMDPRIGVFEDVLSLKDLNTESMRSEIGKFFGNKRERDDLILFYFSGHGDHDGNGKPYLIGTDSEKEALFYKGIEKDFLFTAVNRSFSRRKIIILDCCYSGAFDPAAKGEFEDFQHNIQGHGFAILTASSPGEISWEANKYIKGADNSLFTHFLVEGLRTGLAARSNGEVIYIDEIYQYTFDKVTHINPNQTPNRMNKLEGNIFIARNPRKQNVQIDERITNLLKDPDPRVREVGFESLVDLFNHDNSALIDAVINELNIIAASDTSGIMQERAKKYLEDYNLKVFVTSKIHEMNELISKQMWDIAYDSLGELRKLDSKNPDIETLERRILGDAKKSYNFRIKMAVDLLNSIADLFEKNQIIVMSELNKPDLDLKAEANVLRIYAKNLYQNIFTIFFVGSYKTGKSTLINSLLGDKVAPVSAIPKTAFLTRFVWGESLKVKIIPVQSNEPIEISLEDLDTQYSRSLFDENEVGKFENTGFIQVELPLQMLKNGVSLIDTPGLGEHSLFDHITKDAIAQASAVVFVIDPYHPLGHSDRKFLKNHVLPRADIKGVFFIINKANTVKHDQWEQVGGAIKTGILNFLDEIIGKNDTSLFDRRIFFVDALDALESRMTNKMDVGQPFLFEFLEFEQELTRFINGNERTNVYFGSTFLTMKTTIERVEKRIQEKLISLGLQLSDVQKNKTLNELAIQEEKNPSQKAIRTEFDKTFNNTILEIQKEIQQLIDLRDEMGRILEKARSILT